MLMILIILTLQSIAMKMLLSKETLIRSSLVLWLFVSQATLLFQCLNHPLHAKNQDSLRIISLIDSGAKLKFQNPDSAAWYYQKAETLLEQAASFDSQTQILLKAILLKNEGVLQSVLSNNELAIQRLHQSLALFDEVSALAGKASALTNLGVAYYYQGTNDSAFPYFKLAADTYLLLGDTNSYFENLSRIAVIYHYTSAYDSALHYNRILVNRNKNSSKASELEYLAMAYNNMGISFQSLGLLDSASIYYHKAIKIFEPMEDEMIISSLLSNLGDVFTLKKENLTALSYYKQSLAIISKYPQKPDITKSLLSIGETYTKLNQADSASYYLLRAADSSISLQNPFISGLVQRGLGNLFFEQKNYEKAYKSFMQALQKFNEANSRSYQIEMYTSLAEVQLTLKKHQQALNHLEAAHSLLKDAEWIHLRRYYDIRYQTLKQTHQVAGALQALELSTAYNDSINSQEKERTIRELEARYQSAKNQQMLLEQQLRLNDLEISRQEDQQQLKKVNFRFLIIAGALLMLLLLSLLIFGFLDQRRKKQALLAERELFHHKLALAKKQLEPHFILNALNSISLLFQKQEHDEAVYYLGKTASLINLSLMNADKFIIDLSDELSFIENYLCLQTRLLESFTFQLEYNQASVEDQLRIPFSLVFTFVENAIKHGLRLKEGPKHLLLKLIHKDEAYQIEIIDNGIGRKKSKELKTTDTGKGMAIVNIIIEAYNKIHQGRITYQVNDRLDEEGKVFGTIVTIKL